MGPIKVTVSTHRQEYFPGDVVDGSVNVEVCTKNSKESSADELKLEMIGQIKTVVVYYTGSGKDRKKHTAKETKDFLSHDVQLASFGGKAASGMHSFPFSMTLPVGLPPSLKDDYREESGWSIQYSFNAQLHRPGLLNFDAKDSSVLRVLATPQQAGDRVPVMVGPATTPVKFCCCFNRGSMSLGFNLDRSMAGHNETIEVAVVARNDSSSSVNKLTIQLQQEVNWSAKGHSKKREKTLASILVLPGSELGGFQWAGTGDVRGHWGENIQSDLQQQLVAGAGARFPFVVPEHSLHTLEVENIKIRHSVGIVVDTECCIAEPSLWAPLSVVPTGAGPEAQPGAPSLVPLQTVDTSGPYGPASIAPYPNTNPSQGMTYGAAPGIAPGMQYSIQQALPHASTVEMDEYGHAKPEYAPQTAA